MTPATFTKSRRDAPEHFFAAEAAGLRWLADAGGVPIAGVQRVTRTELVIDRVPTANATATAAEEFGRLLARTHDAGAAHFGAGPDGGPGVGWIGDAPLPLRSTAPASWGDWYASDRCAFHARRAGLSDPALDRVLARLTDGEFDDGAPPARHHATASRNAAPRIRSRSKAGAKDAVSSPRLMTRIRSHMPMSSSSSDEMKSTPPPAAARRSARA